MQGLMRRKPPRTVWGSLMDFNMCVRHIGGRLASVSVCFQENVLKKHAGDACGSAVFSRFGNAAACKVEHAA